MQVIQIKDVCKAFDQRQVLNNISLSVEEGGNFLACLDLRELERQL